MGATKPMDWKTLLCTTRVRELRGGTRSTPDHRSEFDRDFDRIVFCSPVRRLKDKTQVFPLDPNDFVRTRLTHSLEVSSVARGLTKSVIAHLPGPLAEPLCARSADLQTVSATAALVHDLGNPPFGHFGEDAIRSWFATPQGKEALKPLSGASHLTADLTTFEGNARTVRLLASLQILADNNGLNLTAATLSASMKYTLPSHEANSKSDNHAHSKPGYCATEHEIVSKIRECTGTGSARHPLTYIVEAADDCVYGVCDVEDGIRKGVISWDAFKKELGTLDESHELLKVAEGAESFINERAKKSGLGLNEAAAEAFSVQFRVAAQGLAIQSATECFVENYEAILAGEFKGELLSEKDSRHGSRLVTACKRIGRSRVYCTRPTIELELRGRHILHTILDVLWEGVATFDGKAPKPKTAEGKAYSLLSHNYRCLFEHDWKAAETRSDAEQWRHYLKLMLITDYVSGMTDGFASALHKSLRNA